MTLNKKVYNKIKLSIWPFEKGEVVKLYWIDHPFREREQWVMNIYFQSQWNKEIQRCKVPWGTLPILKIGCLYTDGELLTYENKTNSAQENSTKKIGVFTFDINDSFECNSDKHSIKVSNDKHYSVVSNSFRLKQGSKEFRIPVIEVIRSVMARNRKLVYAVLEPNSLDFFFLIKAHEQDPTRIRIDFTRQYPTDLILSNQHVRHLLWISTDDQAKKAWNGVHRSLYVTPNKGLCFPFPIKGDFQIKARYSEKNAIIRIEEIVSFSGQTFNINDVIITSPLLKKSSYSNKNKLRTYKDISNDELTIDSEGDGAKKSEEILDIEMANIEFTNPPNIHRQRNGQVKKRLKKDENTIEMEIERQNLVSTADVGGSNTVMGLEYRDMNEVADWYDGDIGEFIKVLTSMNIRYDDVSIQYVSSQLPEGLKGKKFCKLDDGITPRSYILARITHRNGTIVHLLEIERKGKSLSTLALMDQRKNSGIEDHILQEILTGLVNKNGTWDKKIMSGLAGKGIITERIKHTYVKREIWEHADRLYEKIVYMH
jgi:hypothetical protein